MDLSFEAEYTLFNCSTSIRVLSPANTGKLLIFVRWSKIVKAERSGKMKTKFSILTRPRRILSYLKIVKAERSGKMKTKFSILTRPRRILPTHLCIPTNLRGFTFVNHRYSTNVSRFFPCLFTFVCPVFIQMYQRRVFCRQYFF